MSIFTDGNYHCFILIFLSCLFCILYFSFFLDFISVQSLSRVQLCGPMDSSTPGFPVHHQLLEPAQTHVRRVSDTIQPSHPLSSPSPPAFSLSQHQGLCIRWPKYWSLGFSISPSNEYSRLISFRIDRFGSPCSPMDSQESVQQHSSTASILQCSTFFIVQITSIHDYWKNHSFDCFFLTSTGLIISFHFSPSAGFKNAFYFYS